ncbi:MAG: Beta-N-acetylhexosaminidase [Mucilaginibacter sp.]|uniref:beta-N-acetylhexosaminidase n=1 Tax=Mucilaginibacter sp. TaxID=1882438 RepID=UPI0026342582|nr:family 20 glycosylhydrolase [Mucilaginibacter sp.]MDB5003623.1 Beta-N-acetylhexosaminidase [Mucilaginibacter sp.]
MKKLLSFILLLINISSLSAQNTLERQPLSIVPYPLSVKAFVPKFVISRHTIIRVDANNAELQKIAQTMAGALKNLTGYPIAIGINKGVNMTNSIVLTLNNTADTLGDEGYRLSVHSEGIIIRGNKPQGIFYGLQTFKQLLPVKAGNTQTVSLPSTEIVDKPRFKWRGSMLDVGRYFYSVDFIKKYLDYMAMYKLNTFHWHLTEDHGWRIEIKKYLKLTQIGAWRAGTQYDRSPYQVDNNPHGGYYTQDQVREIVAYAQDRYITVVPEIEMPGHSLAALVAYPELSCTGGPFKMPLQWGIQKDVYCPGNEQTFQFLEDVLTEVAALFPSPIIHIGGDECPKDRWKTCPKCQARIKAEGLKDEHELQSYFIKRIENFLQTKNKKIIGWDEILEGGLAPNATVMSWRGIEGGIAAAKQHHDVVMTPSNFMYFDYYQGEPYHEPIAIGGMLTLEKVYSYEPVPAALSADEAVFIKGVQANVWSEFIHSAEKVEYMLMPRAAALAEVAWTQPRLKNWEGFKERMEGQYKRYDAMGINYSKSAYNVWQNIKIDALNKKATISLTTNSSRPEIHYTTDASEPALTSPVYNAPFETNTPAIIKSATFKNGKQVSKVSISAINPENNAFEVH